MRSKVATFSVKLLVSVFLALAVYIFVPIFDQRIVPQANATNAIDVIVKTTSNAEICELDSTKKVCDLDSEKMGSGTISLNIGNTAEVTLAGVDAPNVVISFDDPAIINANGIQKFAKIEQTESSASLTISSGEYSLANAKGTALEAAGKVNLKEGVKLTADGKVYGAQIQGNLLLDKNSSLIGLTNSAIGGGVLANGFLVSEGVHLEGRIADKALQNEDFKAENVFGIGVGWGNTLKVDGKGGNRATIIASGNVGISGVYPDATSVSDIYMQEADVTVNASTADGITGKYLSFTNDTALNIVATGGSAIGAAQGVALGNSKLEASAVNGIATNGDVSISGNSKVLLTATANGIEARKSVEIAGKSDVQITATNGDPASPNSAIYAGANITINLVDEGGNLRLEGKSAPLKDGKNAGGALICGGEVIGWSTILPDIAKGDEPQYIVIQDDKVETIAEALKSENCNINVSEKNIIADGRVIELQNSVALKGVGAGADAQSIVLISPNPTPFLEKLWYTFGLWLILAGLLILALLILVIYLIVHKKPALLVLDLQNDLMDDGAMKIEGAKETADLITGYIRQFKKKYQSIYAVREWHINPGNHFMTWTTHCMANTTGANFVQEFDSLLSDLQKSKKPRVEIVSKGMQDDGYSAFEGTLANNSTLEEALKSAKVKKVSIVGIALDYSVMKTALDAVNILGAKKVKVLTNLTASVNGEVDKITQKLQEKGVIVKQ